MNECKCDNCKHCFEEKKENKGLHKELVMELELNESRIYTSVNADKIKIGSKGYYSNSLEGLIMEVKNSLGNDYGEIYGIKPRSFNNRFFIKGVGEFNLFYLVAEPEECRPHYDMEESLKHLGIKPMFVSRCKQFKVCESAKNGECKGCNVWNYLYDIKALQKWCKEHNKDFVLFTMEMQRHLEE